MWADVFFSLGTDLQHQIWLLLLDERLSTIPITDGISQGRILDIGCGSGSWSLGVARALPQARILGVDLTPPSITDMPSNLEFVKADADDLPWDFGGGGHDEEKFSLIFGRMLASGIHNWPRLLAQSSDHLEAGGWLELIEIFHPFAGENEELANPVRSKFIQFGYAAEKAWALQGLDYRASALHSQRLSALGMINVSEDYLRLPLGEWSADLKKREIGKLMLNNFQMFVSSAGVSVLTGDPTVQEDAARTLVDAALKDLTQNHLTAKFYLNVYVQLLCLGITKLIMILDVSSAHKSPSRRLPLNIHI